MLYERPKDLWTRTDDGGDYEKAFGDGAKITDSWSNEVFDEAILALALAWRIEDETKKDKKLGRSFLYRLRFHLLSLMGMCIRSDTDRPDYHTLVKNVKRCDELWARYWPTCRQVLTIDHNNNVGVDPDKLSLHAYMRSEERWRCVSKSLADVLGFVNAPGA